jgi:uncharacterized protein (TIGR02391 family)
MIDKYIAINRSLRTINVAVHEALYADNRGGDDSGVGIAGTFLDRAVSDLNRIWPKEIDSKPLKELTTLVNKAAIGSFYSVLEHIMPKLENLVDNYFSSQPMGDISHSILDLLHPRIINSSYAQYRSGHYRDAVLNAILAVYDFIRARTGIDKDGPDLIGEVFSLSKPLLVFNSLDIESGRNEQKGFIQLLQGLYVGVRNPKAHTLNIEANQLTTAQYLVFASLLCRKIEDCQQRN